MTEMPSSFARAVPPIPPPLLPGQLSHQAWQWLDSLERRERDAADPQVVTITLEQKEKLRQWTEMADDGFEIHRRAERLFESINFWTHSLPVIALSAFTSIIVVGLGPEALETYKGYIALMSGLDTILAAIGTYWRWQARMEKNRFASERYDHLRSRLTLLRAKMEINEVPFSEVLQEVEQTIQEIKKTCGPPDLWVQRRYEWERHTSQYRLVSSLTDLKHADPIIKCLCPCCWQILTRCLGRCGERFVFVCSCLCCRRKQSAQVAATSSVQMIDQKIRDLEKNLKCASMDDFKDYFWQLFTVACDRNDLQRCQNLLQLVPAALEGTDGTANFLARAPFMQTPLHLAVASNFPSLGLHLFDQYAKETKQHCLMEDANERVPMAYIKMDLPTVEFTSKAPFYSKLVFETFQQWCLDMSLRSTRARSHEETEKMRRHGGLLLYLITQRQRLNLTCSKGHSLLHVLALCDVEDERTTLGLQVCKPGEQAKGKHGKIEGTLIAHLLSLPMFSGMDTLEDSIDKLTPLEIAAKRHNAHAFKEFFSRIIDLTAQDPEKVDRTKLQQMVQGAFERVQEQPGPGKDVHSDEARHSCCCCCCSCNNAAGSMLGTASVAAKFVDVKIQPCGRTLLHYACGADLNVYKPEGTKGVKLVSYLLQQKATYVKDASNKEETPLGYALKSALKAAKGGERPCPDLAFAVCQFGIETDAQEILNDLTEKLETSKILNGRFYLNFRLTITGKTLPDFSHHKSLEVQSSNGTRYVLKCNEAAPTSDASSQQEYHFPAPCPISAVKVRLEHKRDCLDDASIRQLDPLVTCVLEGSEDRGDHEGKSTSSYQPSNTQWHHLLEGFGTSSNFLNEWANVPASERRVEIKTRLLNFRSPRRLSLVELACHASLRSMGARTKLLEKLLEHGATYCAHENVNLTPLERIPQICKDLGDDSKSEGSSSITTCKRELALFLLFHDYTFRAARRYQRGYENEQCLVDMYRDDFDLQRQELASRRDPHDRTLLHWAAFYGVLPDVVKLMTWGAKADALDCLLFQEFRFTLLSAAEDSAKHTVSDLATCVCDGETLTPLRLYSNKQEVTKYLRGWTISDDVPQWLDDHLTQGVACTIVAKLEKQEYVDSVMLQFSGKRWVLEGRGAGDWEVLAHCDMVRGMADEAEHASPGQVDRVRRANEGERLCIHTQRSPMEYALMQSHSLHSTALQTEVAVFKDPEQGHEASGGCSEDETDRTNSHVPRTNRSPQQCSHTGVCVFFVESALSASAARGAQNLATECLQCFIKPGVQWLTKLPDGIVNMKVRMPIASKKNVETTLLHVAARFGLVHVCDELLRRNCQFSRDRKDMSPLDYVQHPATYWLLILPAFQSVCRMVHDEDSTSAQGQRFEDWLSHVDSLALKQLEKMQRTWPLSDILRIQNCHDEKQSLAHYAAMYGLKSVVEHIVQELADNDCRDRVNQHNHLPRHVIGNQLPITCDVKDLIKNEIGLLLQQADDEWRRSTLQPMMSKGKAGHPEIQQKIVNKHVTFHDCAVLGVKHGVALANLLGDTLQDTELKRRLNEKDHMGVTPLHKAAEHNNVSVIKFLLEKEVNVEEKNLNTERPLHVVSRKGWVDAIAELVAAKARVDAKCKLDGQTPLHLAMQQPADKLHDVIKALTSLADPDTVRSAFLDTDSQGLTPIHHLFKAFANSSEANSFAKTIEQVVRSQSQSVEKMLTRTFCDPLRKPGSFWKTQGNVLHEIAWREGKAGCQQLFSVLLCGVSEEEQQHALEEADVHEKRPIELAVQAGNLDVVTSILENSRRISREFRQLEFLKGHIDKVTTPEVLIFLAKQSHLIIDNDRFKQEYQDACQDTFHQVIKVRVDPEEQRKLRDEFDSILNCNILAGQLFDLIRSGEKCEDVIQLIEKNVDIRSTVEQETQETPLHAVLGARGFQDDIAKYLIRRDADLEAKDSKGQTPLHKACEVFASEIQKHTDGRADKFEKTAKIESVCKEIVEEVVNVNKRKHGSDLSSLQDCLEVPFDISLGIGTGVVELLNLMKSANKDGDNTTNQKWQSTKRFIKNVWYSPLAKSENSPAAESKEGWKCMVLGSQCLSLLHLAVLVLDPDDVVSLLTRVEGHGDNDKMHNVRDKSGQTPFFYVVAGGKKELVKHFIDKHPSVDLNTLREALTHQDVAPEIFTRVKDLWDLLRNADTCEIFDEAMETLSENQIGCALVEPLIKAMTMPRKFDCVFGKRNYTILHLASMVTCSLKGKPGNSGDPSLLERCLGCFTGESSKAALHSIVNAPDEEGMTPLHHATTRWAGVLVAGAVGSDAHFNGLYSRIEEMSENRHTYRKRGVRSAQICWSGRAWRFEDDNVYWPFRSTSDTQYVPSSSHWRLYESSDEVPKLVRYRDSASPGRDIMRLLEVQADPTKRDNAGRSSLHVACYHSVLMGDLEHVKAYVHETACLVEKLPTLFDSFAVQDKDGHTPLDLLMHQGEGMLETVLVGWLGALLTFVETEGEPSGEPGGILRLLPKTCGRPWSLVKIAAAAASSTDLAQSLSVLEDRLRHTEVSEANDGMGDLVRFLIESGQTSLRDVLLEKIPLDRIFIIHEERRDASEPVVKILPQDCLIAIRPQTGSSDRTWCTKGTKSLKRSSGKLYHEVELTGFCHGPQIGWLTDQFKEGDYNGMGVGDDEHGWAVDGVRHKFWHAGASTESSSAKWPRDWQPGDVIGLAVDIEAASMQFSLNGEWLDSLQASFDAGGHPLFPAVTTRGSYMMRIHGEAWKFKPPSDEYEAWADVHVLQSPSTKQINIWWVDVWQTNGTSFKVKAGYSADGCDPHSLVLNDKASTNVRMAGGSEEQRHTPVGELEDSMSNRQSRTNGAVSFDIDISDASPGQPLHLCFNSGSGEGYSVSAVPVLAHAMPMVASNQGAKIIDSLIKCNCDPCNPMVVRSALFARVPPAMLDKYYGCQTITWNVGDDKMMAMASLMWYMAIASDLSEFQKILGLFGKHNAQQLKDEPQVVILDVEGAKLKYKGQENEQELRKGTFVRIAKHENGNETFLGLCKEDRWVCHLVGSHLVGSNLWLVDLSGEGADAAIRKRTKPQHYCYSTGSVCDTELETTGAWIGQPGKINMISMSLTKLLRSSHNFTSSEIQDFLSKEIEG